MAENQRTCTVDGCERLRRKREWCTMHYGRWRKTGETGPAGTTRIRSTCRVDGCTGPVKGHELCGRHYYRMRTHGSTNNPLPTEDDRFWGYIHKTESCWIWAGTQNDRGYGLFSVGGRHVQVHRYAYEKARGRIPDGLTIDHLCMVKNCVNPEHLEAVTGRENTRRMQAAYGMGWVVTHCPAGHGYTPENTYIEPKGSRACRICRVDRTRRWRAANRK